MEQKPVSKQLAEIMRLSYLVNKNTPYCVFFDFSGHVNTLSISIRHSKVEYQERISDISHMSLDKEDKKNLVLHQKLNKIEKNLRKYLVSREVIKLDK